MRGLMRLAVIPLAFLLTGADFHNVAQGATAQIDEHGECRMVENNHVSGHGLFVPTKTAPEWAAMRDSAVPGVTVSACAPSCPAGSQSFTTAGNHSFEVPCHNTMTVEVWGAGCGGNGCVTGSSFAAQGSHGEASSWDSALVGGGGQRATASVGGAGGSASGGTTNTPGQAGASGNSHGGKGGDSPNGGSGGAQLNTAGNGNPGNAPGGGGGGSYQSGCHGDGGGGGGYSSITYSAGTYAVGATIPVTVGAGGLGGVGNRTGGKGADGEVTITWN